MSKMQSGGRKCYVTSCPFAGSMQAMDFSIVRGEVKTELDGLNRLYVFYVEIVEGKGSL